MKTMKKRLPYISPDMNTYLLASREQLLNNSLKANFISSPTVGDAGDDDEIGTESRRTRNESWSD